MGQGISAQTGSEGSARRGVRYAGLSPRRDANQVENHNEQEEGEQSLLSSNQGRAVSDGSSRFPSMATFRRHISTHTVPTSRDGNLAERAVPTRNEVLLEQEERPLVSMEDLRMPDARITNIGASPMPRRLPLWRLGSRRSRRYSTMGALREESVLQDLSMQPNLSNATVGNTGPPRRNRHSMLSTLPGLFNPSPEPTLRRIPPISGPIPFSGSSSSYDFIGSDVREAPTPQQPEEGEAIVQSTATNRNSRFARVRRSISGPIENILGNTPRPRQREGTDTSTHRLSRLERTEELARDSRDETEYLLPPLNLADAAINLNETNMESRVGGNTTQRLAPTSERAERPRSWASRLADSVPHPRREGRGVNLLRGRSSRLIRRDDEAPLSRILQVAAAAIAAQLSGSQHPLANLESMGDDLFDGSLNNFVEELNTTTDSAHNSGSVTASSTGQPLNFWRVFRFASPSEDHMTTTNDSDNPEPRTVTLVVVGVRSVPSSSIPRDTNADSGSDAVPGSTPARPGPSGVLRSLNRARLGRRSSIANPTPFPNQYDSQRHPRHGLNRFSGPPSLFASDEEHPSLLRRSRTYSDTHGLDILSSTGASAATSRPSSPTLGQHGPADDGDGVAHDQETGGRSRSPHHSDGISGDRNVHQRRRSASDLVRHRNLGSGASRRNGTIDPDGGPVQGRSWLIYVVGTNLPEDHPAFTTPSLFTDNPSYEDLLLLSNILGPVKPPVASNDDIAASGGRFRLVVREENGSFRGSSINDDGAEITILSTERCQICLEDYALEQELRQLTKCSHVFHQECVDEVSPASLALRIQLTQFSGSPLVGTHAPCVVARVSRNRRKRHRCKTRAWFSMSQIPSVHSFMGDILVPVRACGILLTWNMLFRVSSLGVFLQMHRLGVLQLNLVLDHHEAGRVIVADGAHGTNVGYAAAHALLMNEFHKGRFGACA
jgi:hypothetical protein